MYGTKRALVRRRWVFRSDVLDSKEGDPGRGE